MLCPSPILISVAMAAKCDYNARLTNMAEDIDFLSGSCKQDVTDLICLSARLNFNRRLEVGERHRRGKVKSEGMWLPIGALAIKLNAQPLSVSGECQSTPAN